MPLDVPGSWRGVRNRFNEATEDVRQYFDPVPELLERYDWAIALAYVFTRLEEAHSAMLYAGCVKLHRANHRVAHRFVDRQHVTRDKFKKLFKNVYGVQIPNELALILVTAEKIRDKVVHGKTATDVERRGALIGVLHYAEHMNQLVEEKAAFKPFSSDRRGYTGRREALDESTSAWLMRGMGFDGAAPDGPE